MKGSEGGGNGKRSSNLADIAVAKPASSSITLHKSSRSVIKIKYTHTHACLCMCVRVPSALPHSRSRSLSSSLSAHLFCINFACDKMSFFVFAGSLLHWVWGLPAAGQAHWHKKPLFCNRTYPSIPPGLPLPLAISLPTAQEAIQSQPIPSFRFIQVEVGHWSSVCNPSGRREEQGEGEAAVCWEAMHSSCCRPLQLCNARRERDETRRGH